ncbi:hypothetical protein PLICRDRAFT_40334 [Plicaturopsis crispa FD-325 SS-3]|nr:hypothetical protein PLICRDRAFT_40334 [Plicaturopsis crispa FD-325 SS-3]
MSLGEADAKFPGRIDKALPPSPSRENPGQVYPKSDPAAAPANSVPGTGSVPTPHSAIGNPFLFASVLEKLDHSLSEVISAIENETNAMGESSEEAALLEKFKSWRQDLDRVRAGETMASRGAEFQYEPAEEGGMFAD